MPQKMLNNLFAVPVVKTLLRDFFVFIADGKAKWLKPVCAGIWHEKRSNTTCHSRHSHTSQLSCQCSQACFRRCSRWDSITVLRKETISLPGVNELWWKQLAILGNGQEYGYLPLIVKAGYGDSRRHLLCKGPFPS